MCSKHAKDFMFNSQHDWGRPKLRLNDHGNLHFDNEEDLHTKSNIYEANGPQGQFDLLIISRWLHVLNPRRSGWRAKSIRIRHVYEFLKVGFISNKQESHVVMFSLSILPCKGFLRPTFHYGQGLWLKTCDESWNSSKGHTMTIEVEFYMVTSLQVKCKDICDWALNWMLFHYHRIHVRPSTQ